MFLKKEKWCYGRYQKLLKNHPLEVAKKCVETYSSSYAAAHDPEERVQLNKPKHDTIYKTEQEKKTKCKKRKKKNERKGRVTDLE